MLANQPVCPYHMCSATGEVDAGTPKIQHMCIVTRAVIQASCMATLQNKREASLVLGDFGSALRLKTEVERGHAAGVCVRHRHRLSVGKAL